MTKKFRVYCGPCIVKDVAHRLRLQLDNAIVTKGTAHVYVTCNCDADDLLSILGRGGGWSESDILELPL